jgi:membrane associated rhomboid family serine protease
VTDTGRHPPPTGTDDRIRIRASWVIAAGILATWIGALASGQDPDAPTAGGLIRLGASWSPLTRDGQWWRLLTAAFVHTGHVHVLANAAGLIAIGTVVERRIGTARGGLILLGGTVVAGAASLAWSPYTVSAGASGAVAALCGALAVLLVRGGWSPRARIAWTMVVAAMVGWGAYLAVASDGVDHAAHVAGVVAGAAIAAAPRAWIGAAAAAAATAALLVAARPPVDVEAHVQAIVRTDARSDAILRGVGLRAHGPRLARTLEVEVIAPLRVAVAALAAVGDDAPPAVRRRAARLEAYGAARLRALELYARHLETGDDALLDDLAEANAEVRRAAAAIQP